MGQGLQNARSRFLIGDAAEPSLEPWRSSKDKHEVLYPYGYELSKGNAPRDICPEIAVFDTPRSARVVPGNAASPDH